MATPQITTVRQPKHEDAYTVTETSTTTPKTVTTEYAAPSPEVQARIDAALEPAKKAYGVNPDGSMTPLSVLGYDPAKEARRRQREAELAEFKKKESGWYNGIALAMDAMTAGLGGNVYLRDVNKAKEAQQKQDQLRAEQKAEDVQNAQQMQNAGLSYGKWADAITRNYLGKVKRTTGGENTKTTSHTEQNGYTTRAFSSGGSTGAGGGAEGESGDGGKGPYFVVKVNSDDPSNAEYKKYKLDSVKEFNAIRGILEGFYMKKVADEMRNADPATGQTPVGGYFDRMKSIGAMNDKGEWIDSDMLMYSGEFYGLDDAVRKQISEATGGRVKLHGGSDAGWKGSSVTSASDKSGDDEYDDIFG